MVATRHTQSLTDFRQNANETLERLAKTGEAEVITVNGEARAVVMSPEAFDGLAREVAVVREVEAMRKSLEQIKAGKYVTPEQLSRRLRGKLEEFKARRGKAG